MIDFIQYIISILPLTDDDNNATISNTYIDNNSNDYGLYFDIISLSLSNSIVNLNISSQIILSINSNYETTINTDSISSISILNFIQSLRGRPIIINKIPISEDGTTVSTIIYMGFISVTNDVKSIDMGTQIVLNCNTLLSQLDRLSSNGNWNDTIKNWGNIFSIVGVNLVNKKQFFKTIVTGTLSENKPFNFIDGKMIQIPDKLWAMIIPTDMRLEVMREILIPYNRIVWQSSTGDFIVQPLFINDYADTAYNVDAQAQETDTANWIEITATNNATELPNRIDVMFGINPPGDMFQNVAVDNSLNNAFYSAPYINLATNQITAVSNNSIDYTLIYKTSTRLYNSGKWIMPQQRVVSIEDAINNTISANVLQGQQYKTSSEYWNPQPITSNFARLYAQLYLAEINVNNYNATIIYDYIPLSGKESALAKIIIINNQSEIDYTQMIVINETISYSAKTGSILTLETAPLLSITAAWSNI